MIRQHQFTQGRARLHHHTGAEQGTSHERMLALRRGKCCARLDVHYRVVTLCAGDMGFAAPEDL